MVNLKNVRYGFSIKQIFNYIAYKTRRKNTTFLKYKPIWLLIYVSDLCNLRCEMCPHHSGKNNNFIYQKKLDKKFISLDLLKKIYTKFPESIFVMLGGVGEPLLHPQFKEIIKLTSSYKKKINIITNGTLLNDDLCDFLTKEKMINQISISLNASNSVEYNSICKVKEEMFNKTVSNIKTLVSKKKKNNSKVEIVVSAVCSHEFIESSYAFLKFCDTLGVDRIDLHRYIDFNICDGLNDIDELNDDINNLYDFTINNIKTRTNLPHKIISEKFNNHCDWYFKNLSFDSFGNIGSCGRVINPSKEYGNINDNNDIWNNEYMQKMRKKFINNEIVTKYCEKCVENNKN